MAGPINPLRVCIVALNAYPAIDPEAAGPIGGIETRAWMFARGLARRDDCDVAMFVRHHRRPRRTAFEGVTIIPLVDRLYRIRQEVRTGVGKKDRFPWLTLHRWNSRLLWQFPLVALERLLRGAPGDPWRVDDRLAKLDTDIFCTFGVQSHSATVIASAHATNRRAVLFLGSDGDLDSNYTLDSRFASTYGDRGDVCWRILQEADVIIAQTTEQQRLLRERFNRDSVVIANPIDVDEWDARCGDQPGIDLRFERYVLWVGRAEDVHKCPGTCLELARRCPEVDFLMVLNPRDPVVERRVRSDAPDNVQIVSYVPFSQMPAVFARAATLLNTSSLEGFPNVFLQAAVSRVPIASLNVGREFLDWLGSGLCADGDLARLATCLDRAWMESTPESTLEVARNLVLKRHQLSARVEELHALLRQTGTP